MEILKKIIRVCVCVCAVSRSLIGTLPSEPVIAGFVVCQVGLKGRREGA